jgi:hypothetical protein
LKPNAFKIDKVFILQSEKNNLICLSQKNVLPAKRERPKDVSFSSNPKMRFICPFYFTRTQFLFMLAFWRNISDSSLHVFFVPQNWGQKILLPSPLSLCIDRRIQ